MPLYRVVFEEQGGYHVECQIQAAVDAVRRSAGMIPWTGDPKTFERLATDPEFGIEEAP